MMGTFSRGHSYGTTAFRITTDNPQGHCQELKVGDSLDVNIPSHQSLTMLPMRYLVQKVSLDEHVITMPITIISSEFSNKEKFYQSVEYKNLVQKIDQCINKMNINLSTNEKQIITLKAKVLTDAESHLQAVSITYSKQGHPTSHRYTENMTCSTITHELLHLTGLVDEYEDYIGLLQTGDQQFFGQKYSCRSTTLKDSIMSSPSHAFEKMTSKRFKVEIEYFLKGQSEKIHLEVKIPNLKDESFGNQKSRATTRAIENFRQIIELTEGREVAEKILIKKITIQLHPESLTRAGLFPGHLRSILHPNCKSKSETYYTCARFAYLAGDQPQCVAKPKICLSQAWIQ